MAQGYAFGRPAPLPSPAEVFIGEMTDAPAEETAGDLLPEAMDPPSLPVQRSAQAGDDTAPHLPVVAPADDDTGYLTGELALTSELLEEIGENPEDS
jgi:hypothetical protein